MLELLSFIAIGAGALGAIVTVLKTLSSALKKRNLIVRVGDDQVVLHFKDSYEALRYLRYTGADYNPDDLKRVLDALAKVDVEPVNDTPDPT